MTDEHAPAGTIADLFDPEPATWGLRGDPYVWRSLRTMLAKRVLPSSERDLVEILRSSFRWLTGSDIDDPTTDRIYREELARGGMTSGQVDLQVWRNILVPLLIERWRIVAPAAGPAGVAGVVSAGVPAAVPVGVPAAAPAAPAAAWTQQPTSHSSR